jgi:hypothetical protein
VEDNAALSLFYWGEMHFAFLLPFLFFTVVSRCCRKDYGQIMYSELWSIVDRGRAVFTWFFELIFFFD